MRSAHALVTAVSRFRLFFVCRMNSTPAIYLKSNVLAKAQRVSAYVHFTYVHANMCLTDLHFSCACACLSKEVNTRKCEAEKIKGARHSANQGEVFGTCQAFTCRITCMFQRQINITTVVMFNILHLDFLGVMRLKKIDNRHYTGQKA